MNISGWKADRALHGLLVLAVLLIFTSVGHAAPDSAREPYIFAVIPQQPPVTMYTNWMPFVEQIMNETGERIKLKVYETMNDFESDYAKGGPDFIYANPTQTVIAHKSQGYIPLVRSAKRVTGIVFVRKDSAIKSIKDLKDKDIAFVGSKSV